MKKMFLIFLLFIACLNTFGQGNVIEISNMENDSIMFLNKPKKGLFGFIGNLLNDYDTLYISPNKYKFAFMLENSNWYEYYRFKSTEDNPHTLIFAPKMSYKLGGYFGWKWIFIGYSIDLRNIFGGKKNKEQRTEFGLSLYSSIVGCDLYYRKSGNAFKVRNIEDFLPDNYENNIITDMDGFSVKIKGLNAYWIFNHKRFSYPAAYSQSTNQRRNAGSLIAGISYSDHNINFDRNRLPGVVLEQLNNTFDFRKISYKDFSLSLGYSYNWVFVKNCLANISLTPAIAYKHSEIETNVGTKYPESNKINFDLITRAGITYNNSKYFVGASLVMHTYDYRSNYFYLNNSFGTIRIYAGFNFLKKKEYRQK